MYIFHDKTYKIQIPDIDFCDNKMQAIYEVAIATNVLYKLGNPITSNTVSISIKGYLDLDLKEKMEKYLSKTMNIRTMIRYNCLLKNVLVKIQCSNKFEFYHKNKSEKNNECYLLYSKGLDSRLAYHILSKNYHIHKISWMENVDSSTNFLSNEIEHHNYIDTFDNDPWESYGLYFIYLVFALNMCIINGVKNVAIGLNKDDLNGFDVISNISINSQCSQSQEFVDFFGNISKIYGINLLIPLQNLDRIAICKEIFKHNIDIEDSVSCVFSDNVECGSCFSCFDKITGILIAVAESHNNSNINIFKSDEEYHLVYNKNILMKFKNNIKSFHSLEQLPIDYIMSINLNRILLSEDTIYGISSKYSLKNTLKTLEYFASTEIGNILFPNSSRNYIKNKNLLCNRVGLVNEDS